MSFLLENGAKGVESHASSRSNPSATDCLEPRNLEFSLSQRVVISVRVKKLSHVADPLGQQCSDGGLPCGSPRDGSSGGHVAWPLLFTRVDGRQEITHKQNLDAIEHAIKARLNEA